jgi:hypothetical protein
LSQSGTVSDLKKKVEEAEGIPVCEQQTLIFAGRQLFEDRRTLAYYGMRNGSPSRAPAGQVLFVGRTYFVIHLLVVC